MGQTEVEVDTYRILEWRDGAVFKIEQLGKRWVPIKDAIPGAMLEEGVYVQSPASFITRRV